MTLELVGGGISPWIYVALAAVGLFLVLYGFIRRFSRMGWWGYQIAIIFGCLYVLGKIALPADPLYRFITVAVALFVVSGVVIGLGAILRTVVTKKRRKKRDAFVLRLFDGLLGIITAVVNLAVIIIVIGGPIVLALDYAGVGAEVFSVVKSMADGGVWAAVEMLALDSLIIALVVVALKGGYRLGLLRSVWTLIVLVLGVAAFAGSIYASFALPWVKDISASFAASLAGSMDTIWAMLIAYGVVSLACFLLCVLVLVLLNLLVSLGIREVDNVRVLRVIDGVLVSAIFFVIMLAIICGVNLLAAHILSGNLGEGAYTIFTQNFDLRGYLSSAPLSKFFYQYNIFRLFY